MKAKVSILIDGGFFLKRYNALYNGADNHTAVTVANSICRAAMKHVQDDYELYRIFYYDCLPLAKRVHNPVSKRSVDFSKTEIYKFRLQLFEELKKKRKVALRLGQISIIISPPIILLLILKRHTQLNIRYFIVFCI